MARKNKKYGSKNSDESSGKGWEIIYTGFILIFLCFFIMLSAFSTIEEAKVMQFVRSFANAVSILPWGTKFDSGQSILRKSSDIIERENDLAKILEELEDLASQNSLEEDISFGFSKEGLVMRLSENALFDLGVAAISRESFPLLAKIGKIIERTTYFMRIEGHTDNLPIHTQSFPSNWELSTARAVNVLRYFIEHHKINPQRLAAVGFGEFQPVVANDTPTNQAKNRRVEIIFLKKDPQLSAIEALR
ncbi:MAG: flagellar motor protein MotB [Desulfobacterales bacterium]|jgi:chemotaxis protein MotB